MKFIFIDTETGGLDPIDHSLLDAAFIITDHRLSIVEELVVSVEPLDGVYQVTPEALRVNRIDIREHARMAVPLLDARDIVTGVLKRYGSKEKLIPAGWSVAFDISFINYQLVPRFDWNEYCSYRSLDVQSIARFAYMLGIIPHAGSLSRTAEALGLPSDYAHTALHDARMTINIMGYLLDRTQELI